MSIHCLPYSDAIASLTTKTYYLLFTCLTCIEYKTISNFHYFYTFSSHLSLFHFSLYFSPTLNFSSSLFFLYFLSVFLLVLLVPLLLSLHLIRSLNSAVCSFVLKNKPNIGGHRYDLHFRTILEEHLSLHN